MVDPNVQQDESGTTARVDVRGAKGRVSIVGPALAVIALVAVIGVIWMGILALNLSRDAMKNPAPPLLNDPDCK